MKKQVQELRTNVQKLHELLKVSGTFDTVRRIIALLIIAIPVSILLGMLGDYVLNTWSEVLSIIAGVFLIDRLRAYYDRERYKESLRRQARSRSNPNAIDAIEIIREVGWLDSNGIRLLEEANLSKGDLSNANLRFAALRKTKLNHTTLTGTDFRDAELIDAEFREATLELTQFAGAKLIGADFSQAYLYGCAFRANRKNLVTLFYEPSESDAILYDEVRNESVKFENAHLKSHRTKDNNDKTIITKIDFRGLQLNRANFRNAELEDISFVGTYLEDANFVGASLRNVDFNNAQLQNAVFAEEIIEEGKPTRVRTISITVDEIKFVQADLTNALLKNCSFVKTDFTRAIFFKADCRNASFSGQTDFSGANLSGMQVNNAEFTNIICNGNTTLFTGITCQELWDSFKEKYKTDEETEIHFKNHIETILEERAVKKFWAKIEIELIEDQSDPTQADEPPAYEPIGRKDVNLQFPSLSLSDRKQPTEIRNLSYDDN